MAYIKISELGNLESADLISSNLAVIPVVSDITSANTTYKTSAANIKTYVGTGDFTVTGNIAVNQDAIVYGNLNVTGNVNYSGSNNLVISDNVIELHVANTANVAEPWTFNDGKDIGLRFHYYDSADQNAALVFSHDERNFEFYSQGSLGANVFAGTAYGNIKPGNVNVVGGTDSVSSTTGAIIVVGGIGLTGNVQTASNIVVGGYANVTANVNANNVYATSSVRTPSYVYATAVQVNTTGTFGTTLTVQGTATVNALTSNGAVAGTTFTGTTGTFTTKVTTANLATGAINANGTATVNALTSNGAISGTTFNASGTATVNALTSNGAISGTTLTLTGTANTRNIIPTTANTYSLGNSANWFSNVYATAVQALYADLAEKYIPDADYGPGTVVVFGGVNEITVTDVEADTRVAGAVSTDPAYVMNVNSSGTAVALRGKTPVKVIGPVEKGDLLVTSNIAGYATSHKHVTVYNQNAVFAKSLENDSNKNERTIWAVIL